MGIRYKFRIQCDICEKIWRADLLREIEYHRAETLTHAVLPSGWCDAGVLGIPCPNCYSELKCLHQELKEKEDVPS